VPIRRVVAYPDGFSEDRDEEARGCEIWHRRYVTRNTDYRAPLNDHSIECGREQTVTKSGEGRIQLGAVLIEIPSFKSSFKR